MGRVKKSSGALSNDSSWNGLGIPSSFEGKSQAGLNLKSTVLVSGFHFCRIRPLSPRDMICISTVFSSFSYSNSNNFKTAN